MTGPDAWRYDEFRHIGVDFSDPAVVEKYDAKQRSSAEEDRRSAEAWGIKQGDRVVEFGPGTGGFALAAAARGASVVAVDVSKEMLAYARRRALKETLDARVEFVHGGFLTYDHVGEPADFVVSEFAFHHLPDFWKAVALQRVYAMLRPGGTFILRDVVFSFPPTEYVARVEEWIESFCGDADSGWSRAEFEMHVRDEHSTFAWILEGMIERAGFTIERKEFRSPVYALYRCVKP